MPSAPPSSPLVSDIPVAAPACSGGALPTMSLGSVITGASPSEITTEAAAMRMRALSPSTDRPSSIVVPIAATAIPMPMMTDGR